MSFAKLFQRKRLEAIKVWERKTATPLEKMEALYKSTDLWGLLCELARNKFFEENLAFFKAFKEFEKKPTQKKWTQLYDTYIEDKASKEINIDANIRKILVDFNNGLSNAEIFDSGKAKEILQNAVSQVCKTTVENFVRFNSEVDAILSSPPEPYGKTQLP